MRTTILVVEDDAEVRRLIRTYLEEGGFTVIDAPGAAEAWAAVERYAGDIPVAVVDIGMPGVGGLDFGGEMCARRPGLKVLYISGLIHSVAVEALAKHAPEAMLRKPFSRSELLGFVHSLLDE